MQEAKEAAKRKLKQMEMEKKEAVRRASSSGRRGPGGSDGGYSPLEQRGMTADAPSFAAPTSAQGGAATGAVSSTSATTVAPTIQMTAKAGQGMKLGRKIGKPIQ